MRVLFSGYHQDPIPGCSFVYLPRKHSEDVRQGSQIHKYTGNQNMSNIFIHASMLSHNEQQRLTKERTNHTVPNNIALAPQNPARKYIFISSSQLIVCYLNQQQFKQYLLVKKKTSFEKIRKLKLQMYIQEISPI
jgi:hypothetical protein